MPPQVPILAQSENKSKFLERLRISDQTEEGKRIYAMMKEDAINGRARLSATPASLLPQYANDPSIKPPYSNTHISESAMHAETLYIYRTARPETRVYYERGHYMEGDAEENWIIKWLLWHVFRYRDNRNCGRHLPSWMPRNSQPPETSGSSSGSRDVPQTPPSMLRASISPAFAPPQHGSYFSQYPPMTHISPELRHVQPTASPAPPAQDNRAIGQGSIQRYWDPVRDAHRSSQ